MAYEDQSSAGLPTPNNKKRKTADLLPRFFRTEANRKFLQGTLDQLVQPGVAEKVNGFFGRKTAKAYKTSDVYVKDVNDSRTNYQLEPTLAIKDSLNNVNFFKDYNDYINQIGVFGGNTANHSKLNSQETYAWNPNIDWDKFVNFREYYWLPTGPASVPVRGQNQEVISTYTVSVEDQGDNFAFVFNDGLTRNPTIKLYRGQRYRFEIDTPGHPFSIAVTRSFIPGSAVIVAGSEGIRSDGLFDADLYGNDYDMGDYIVLPSSGSVTFEADENVSTLYPDGIRRLGEEGEEIANVYVEKGVIEFFVPFNAPDRLFYISKTAVDTSGQIRIYDIEENTAIDVESEIIGKRYYTSANGVVFTNGLKVYFQGNVTPEKYAKDAWYVEGVGEKIVLINENDLIIPAAYSENNLLPYDSDEFDTLPFANATSYPGQKDYLLVNRASLDRNPWTRYNRWFHRNVIEKSFEYNNLPIEIDENTRAKRPIIEFEAGLKLYSYGTAAKNDVDLIDTFTQDVFSTIEGTEGYNVDGIELAQDMRILFAADTDLLVKGKIYRVNFVTIGNSRQISLIETEDTLPLENETVFVKLGNKNAGKTYFYNGTEWKLAQEKTKINQPPLFDLCCPLGNEYSDPTIFDSTTFKGTKIFSYRQGEGAVDTELGFPLSYRNIENSGDIVFDFNLLTDTFLVQTDAGSIEIKTDTANLRKYKSRDVFNWVNGWSSVPTISKQKVLRQYTATLNLLNDFEIDMFDNAANISDLKVNVFVNNKIQLPSTYSILKQNKRAFINFVNQLSVGDVVLIKATTAQDKNQNGWYEFPYNLERNPDNEDISDFTFGEVLDHVDTMIEDLQDNFNGRFPGPSNLRDLGNLDEYGKKFLKHSGPINLPLYHITNRDNNLVKAIEYSSREYSRFKKVFLSTAESLGFDGPVVQHVDKIINTINEDKVKTQPFYFSDMLGVNFSDRIEFRVTDPKNIFYSINETFSMSELSNKSILVYLNGKQLIHGRDYTFNTDGFVLVTTEKNINDKIEVYLYETTDGSFVPPTPTKLGLYPKYHPEIVLDDGIISTDFEKAEFTFSNDSEYVSKSILGTGFRFDIIIDKILKTYSIEIQDGGENYKVNDIIIVSGNRLSGFTPINDCKIKVKTVDAIGKITEVELSGTATDNANIGPYKIYGQTDDFTFGWFYPIYTRQQDAKNIDSNNQATKLIFKGSNKIFYCPSNTGVFGGEDSVNYEHYPRAIAFVQGHDGSYVRAYQDFRDALLLEFEKRIFNNIKISYEESKFDIKEMVPSRYRSSGYTKDEINSTLLQDFSTWLKNVDTNYIINYFYNINNRFTYNYNSTTNPIDGKINLGFWRAIYFDVYGTYRPHTHPWECLGFTIKPEWWEETYGPAPYTGNNLVLWEDLEQGIIRVPKQPVRILQEYQRPRLSRYIPADEQGNLKDPLTIGLINNFSLRNTSNNFNFGDTSPTELAWRRSSEYAYSVIKAMLLNKPAYALGFGFDLSRIVKNLAGQYVYKDTGKHIRLQDLVLPNTYQDSQRLITSGYVNFIYNLLASNILKSYTDYTNDLQNLKNYLGFRVAGFTDKSKFKILLDSKSPDANNANKIFVPEENYKIFLNTSSPTEIINYSGVIIEKQSDGFVITGYNFKTPFFKYYETVEVSSDVTINVGGISENSVEFQEGKSFIKGQVIRYQGKYYRATNSFTAGEFNLDNLILLPELPVIGGQTAKLRRSFRKDKIRQLNYSTKLKKIQEVVDFILGYEEYLKDTGFKFDFYNPDTGTVENWTQSVREFLFWTTQQWAAGTTLTLSASAYVVDFQSNFAVVDDIFDGFYDYSLLKTNGLNLDKKFSSILRDENNFGLKIRSTDEGVYNINLPLVQKEHIVLLDNRTVFNDLIYEPSTGYRQERLKVVGYRSDDWNGGLNIPGFVYDDAKVTEWESYKDYRIGELVKYRQFYYVAKNNVTGTEFFDDTNWFRLNERPESELITNFDYRINQFGEFYDLDTDGFDADIQALGQRLVGYQKRDYLANIINDDISQYKFYQGFIQEKGTINAIEKLFGKLSSTNQESLELYEQWALQVGRYGSTDSIDQVEYIIEENRLEESPQAFELVQQDPTENFDRIYRIKPFEVYDKPSDYNHEPFPTTVEKQYILSGGYVHEDDIDLKTGSVELLNNIDLNNLNYKDYIWITDEDPLNWNVYQIVRSNINVTTISALNQTDERRNNLIQLTVDRYTAKSLNVGDIIGIKDAESANLTGLYVIDSVNPTDIVIKVSPEVVVTNVPITDNAKFILVKLKSVRCDNLESANDIVQDKLFENQRLWVDDYKNGEWKVIENTNVYQQIEILVNPVEFDSTFHEFSSSIDVTKDNRNLFVSSPGNLNGSVYYYKRTRDNSPWVQEIEFLPEGENIAFWKPFTNYKINNKIKDDSSGTTKFYISKLDHTSTDTFNLSNWSEVSSPYTLYNPSQARFGNSISVSEDGEYLAIGSPLMNEVKTRYKGEFDEDRSYTKNDIIKYRETLWQAVRDILPKVDEQAYSTFDTYLNIVQEAGIDSTNVNLLIAGNAGLQNSTVSNDLGRGHILVRAPADMYLGSDENYILKLFWNIQSFANNGNVSDIFDLEQYLPFDGQIPEITENTIIGEHEILAKVDNILYVETYVSLPDIGDTIVNDTGSGEVVYVAIEGDDAVIYINNTSGIFEINDELFRVDPTTNDTQFIGFYDQSQTFNIADNLGGFWMIETPAYNNRSVFTDTGRGLVYVDLVPQSATRDLLDYYNIQNDIANIGPYVTNNLNASFIKQLGFFGILTLDDVEIEANYETNLWVVKAPTEFTQELDALPNNGIGQSRDFRLYDLDNRRLDFSNTGLSYEILNKEQTILDVWDGYIDFDLTPFAGTGEVFEPDARYKYENGEFIDQAALLNPGDPITWDKIQDVQTPFDEFGGFAVTTETTSTAEVMFVQRNFNRTRIYIKIVNNEDGSTSPWRKIGGNIAKVELRLIPRNLVDPSRLMGIINNFDNDVVLSSNQTGKLLVFRADTQLQTNSNTWQDVRAIIDEEYYFYNEITNQLGVARDPNPPFKNNKDYRQVYNISADEFGAPGAARQGAVSVYRRTPGGRYELQKVLVSEFGYDSQGNSLSDRGFGHKVKISKNNNLYTLFVGSYIEESPSSSPGSIEFFYMGTDDNINFKGSWIVSQDYAIGEIVKHRGSYYKAVKSITDQNDFTIFDTSNWENIDWRRGTDSNYRGVWNGTYPYSVGSVVSRQGSLYEARTNLGANQPFTESAWQLIESPIDYLGYIPNTSGITYDHMMQNIEGVNVDSIFQIDRDLLKFAIDFDISDDGNVLVVKVKQEDSDSTTGQISLLVYRLYNGKYVFSQQIAEENTIDGFAYSFAISPQGNTVAISEPFDDSKTTDGGAVKIYTLNNGMFGTKYFVGSQEFTEPNQILYSPSNEIVEKFGYSLAFHGNNLAISSLNGDLTIPTTFDSSLDTPTSFDNGYTEFKNVRYDTGIVYVYEQIEDKLIFAERLKYETAQNYFGENILAKENHIYIGMSREGNDLFKGSVIDFRKEKDITAWKITRELEAPVDLDKLQGIFLYNKRTQAIIDYLDFIDPVQGKIAGPADQEITHKVSYDPARYNVGVNAIQDSAWLDEHVGELWWNISTARFTYAYQGSVQYQKDNWNELQPGASIDILEWVESDLTPNEWDAVSDTEGGLTRGISGQTLYGQNRYSQKFIYDEVAQTFKRKFYFWVRNKRTIPNIENRKINAISVANLIASPQTQGYKFVSLLGKNKFVLYNCNNLIYDNDVVINFKFLKDGFKKDQNYYNQYQLIAESDPNVVLHRDIERKWVNSLIGWDEHNNRVPAENIPQKQRYGIQSRPRQSMFVNRFEALKQLIERINRILRETLVLDSFDLSNLQRKDSVPFEGSNLYDLTVSSYADLEFVSTNKIQPATIVPVIINGRIININIENTGRGYKRPPSYEIRGTGSNAEFNLQLNELGQISGFELLSNGEGYNDDTNISVRKFSVLVESDETADGKWTIYQWDSNLKEWQRTGIQDYDVTEYWDYIDWYDVGYNEFTPINFYIEQSYQLSALDDKIGDVVKIKNIGTGGWLLLEKIADIDTEDYTVNYKTIGRQGGTIQFKDTLYNFNVNQVGFDNRTFDSVSFDNDPRTELRFIMQALKEDLFVKNLKDEYNKLFISSLRYVFAEQKNVDWAFKTSFVKVNHKLGELRQDVTFNNDNLPSYQSYVNEVKPYKTVLSEFVSTYDAIDNTNTNVSDFDLPPYYNQQQRKIVPSKALIIDDVLFQPEANINENPRKNWLENYGYSVQEIEVTDGGSGYLIKPKVSFESDIGEGVTAEAYLGYGRITKIVVKSSGKNYITPPRVIIEAPQEEDGTPAKAIAKLGTGVVRTPTINIKFDRINKNFYVTPNPDETVHPLEVVETFQGTSINNIFALKWPMDLLPESISVRINNIEILKSEYSVTNVENTLAGYTRKQGQVKFVTAPLVGDDIEITYRKSLEMLTAEDRIRYAYNPTANMYGSSLSQLMEGIDYGGVEVRSFDFGGEAGWDTQGWYTDVWDEFDAAFEDYVFTFDGSTIAVDLESPLESGIVYNVYYRPDGTQVGDEIRLDDPNYNAGTPANPNAIMNSIVGDGVTTTIFLDEYGISVTAGDVLIVRKNTSDGAFTPDQNSYDTDLSGGDLVYNTATGLNAEDINIDGDGFVTPTTSGGPEELVPGQVLDTLDIQVYTKATGDVGQITSQIFKLGDIIDRTVELTVVPSSNDSVLVKVDSTILDSSLYTIDWNSLTLELDQSIVGTDLNIVTFEGSGQNLVDFGTIIAQQEVADYTIDLVYNTSYQASVTVNGEIQQTVLVESEEGTIIRFNSPLNAADVINYRIFDNSDIINYSQVVKNKFSITDSSAKNNFDIAQQPFYALPTENNIIVKVNNTILNSGYNIDYTISNLREREFRLETFQQPGGNLQATDIKVFVNGVEVSTPVDWRFEIATSTVVLSDDIGFSGDNVEIYVLSDSEYSINQNTLILRNDLQSGDILEIFSFSNHDLLGIEKQKYDVISRITLTSEDIDYFTYGRLTVGEITLRKPATDAQYVWVTVNGELQTPNSDYEVRDTNKLRLYKQPAEDDVIEVIHFAARKATAGFAFRQFKDILNRTHFKRIDPTSSVLSQDLNSYDLRIEVTNGDSLPKPDKGNNVPGIIWIDGERIEYLVKEGNTLRQLRRGTLGTGVKQVHVAGTEVFDQGVTKTVPYRDATREQSIQTDGVSNEFTLDSPVINADNIEVFLSGRRLRKSATKVFDNYLGLDSPEGDVDVAAEFSITVLEDGTSKLILTETPEADRNLRVVKRIGRTWTQPGVSLSDTQTDIAYFLRSGKAL